MHRSLKIATVTAAAAALLTGCGATPDRAPLPTAPHKGAVAATSAPTTPASPAGAGRTPAAPVSAKADPLSALELRVATVGLRTPALSSPARDSKATVARVAQAIPLSPEARTRFDRALPARDEDTSQADGSPWQLVFTFADTGDAVVTNRSPLDGPLTLAETARRKNSDGTYSLAFTATQRLAATDRAHGSTPVTVLVTRAYVLQVAPGSSPAVPFVVTSWTGTRTTLGTPKARS